VLLLVALGLAALCALFTPADAQSVQAMVKNQPFPYPQGVAMDTVLYKSVKAKLQVAEQMKASASASITALQKEITGLRTALADVQNLSDHDAGQARTLGTQLELSESKLQKATTELKDAQRVIDKVVDELPRRVRKTLVSATPDQIATAVVDYIHTLQSRKWTWAGVSTVGGIVLGIAASFL